MKKYNHIYIMNILDDIDSCITYDGCVIFENNLLKIYSNHSNNDKTLQNKYNLLLFFVFNMKIIHTKSNSHIINDIKKLINSIIFFENFVQHPSMIYFIKFIKYINCIYINSTISHILLCLLHHFDLFELRIDEDIYTIRNKMIKQYENIMYTVDEHDDFLAKFIKSCIASIKNKLSM